MKSITALVTMSLLSLHPSDAHAVVAMEIKPEHVYQAGYCSELLRLAQVGLSKAAPKDISEIIHFHSKDIIEGGDNLEFISLGEEDARKDYLHLKGVEGGTLIVVGETPFLRERLTSCSSTLEAIVQDYQSLSCGYGTNRTGSPDLLSLVRTFGDQ